MCVCLYNSGYWDVHGTEAIMCAAKAGATNVVWLCACAHTRVHTHTHTYTHTLTHTHTEMHTYLGGQNQQHAGPQKESEQHLHPYPVQAKLGPSAVSLICPTQYGAQSRAESCHPWTQARVRRPRVSVWFVRANVCVCVCYQIFRN
jgi:hypothetical protein